MEREGAEGEEDHEALFADARGEVGEDEAAEGYAGLRQRQSDWSRWMCRVKR